MIRPGALLSAALLMFPVAGLALTWLSADRQSSHGSEWNVPIRGYDPRDLLQGHYVQYSYDWPGDIAPATGPRAFAGEALCIEGRSPDIATVRVAISNDTPQSCPNRIAAASSTSGRYYVDRQTARALERQLADRTLQGVMRVKLRRDGTLMPLGLSFRPAQATDAESSPTL